MMRRRLSAAAVLVAAAAAARADDLAAVPPPEPGVDDLTAAAAGVLPAAGLVEAAARAASRSCAAGSDGADAALTAVEADSLRQQIYRCWFLPPGMTDAEFVRFTIVMELGCDGGVVALGPPTIVSGGRFFDAASQSAIRALHNCAPYRMPADKYAAWRVVDVTFDTRLEPRGDAGSGSGTPGDPADN